MAKKVLLKDNDNIELMPITRGELVLDSSGNQALHSTEFLATTYQPGLMSLEDKAKLNRITTFTGATSTTAGSAGLVPSPAAGSITRYLAADGTWKALSVPKPSIVLSSIDQTTGEVGALLTYEGSTTKGVVPAFIGASSTDAGAIGAVPAPSVGDQDKFLKGDGTWTTPLYAASSSNGGGATYVKINAKAASTTYYPLVYTNTSSSTSANLYAGASSASTLSIGATGIRFQPTNSYCYCTGGFFEASDERLKSFGNDIEVDLDKLSKLSKKYFTWKDDENKVQHIGVSAQEIQKIYPEIVDVVDDEGHLSVSYDKLSVIALAGIDKLNDKVKSLEKRLEMLEEYLPNNLK